MARFYPTADSTSGSSGGIPPLCYLFARTVPCPTTGRQTPLVPDWHLLKPKEGISVVAAPQIDESAGTWKVILRELGDGPGRLKNAPKRTYQKGKGISLFSNEQISADYIKAKAQAGEMGNALYAVGLRTNRGLEFRPPDKADLKGALAAEIELKQRRGAWEAANILPTEAYPEISSDERPRRYGMPRWADLFSPRQLLAMGTLIDELKGLRSTIVQKEGEELGEAVVHLLSFAIDKFASYNNMLASWHVTHQVIRSVFDRHDFSFKPTFTEMAPCGVSSGFSWTVENVLDAFGDIAKLPRIDAPVPIDITQSSATSLVALGDQSVAAIVVDPPYADNVQYSELADFFYVWLKRTQGHRQPEWFGTSLSQRDQEAVVNVARHRPNGTSAKVAKERANAHYQSIMTEVFVEARRVLRDDGVLTVMFTHKKQESWEALFQSLIETGFVITATWPIKTESEHSLHQAKKNAAQSTVILVARKRNENAGVGYFDAALRGEIRQRARDAAARLEGDRLNAVDQLVGSFGPAMEVFSRYDAVRTDTGEPVTVGRAIDEASDAVSAWRIERLAARGVDGVEAEGRFYLLCWDVLGAAEFRFNEAKLLGHAVGMDVSQLEAAGLVSKNSDKIRILPAAERRRDRPLKQEEAERTLFGELPTAGQRRSRAETLKVHPNDPVFRTALDLCHALALRYLEAGGGAGGIGSARALMQQQRLIRDHPAARLMAALLKAAPLAVRRAKGAVASQFPEFRAWHALLEPLFGIAPPDWTEKAPPQLTLLGGLDLTLSQEEESEEDEQEDEDDSEEDEEA